MSFHFKLETVLKFRKTKKDIAHREKLLAEYNIQIVNKEIESLKNELQDARKLRMSLQKEGGQKSQWIQSVTDFVNGQDIRIKNKALDLNTLQKILDKKLEEFRVIAKEHKAIEILKDKRKNEYKISANKKELKRIDESYILKQRIEEE